MTNSILQFLDRDPRRSYPRWTSTRTSLHLLQTSIISNDDELTEQAEQFCLLLEARETDLQFTNSDPINLDQIWSSNNGHCAMVASNLAKSDIVFSLLNPENYFPRFWKEWFFTWASTRTSPSGILVGYVGDENAEESAGNELRQLYLDLANLGGMEFIELGPELCDNPLLVPFQQVSWPLADRQVA